MSTTGDQLPQSQDWGDSAGSRLAEIQEGNSQKRFERGFQLKVLLLLSAITLALVIISSITTKDLTKDILVVILPAFTFVLGKIGSNDG